MNAYKRDSSKVFDGLMWDRPYISIKPQLLRYEKRRCAKATRRLGKCEIKSQLNYD